MAHKRRKDQMQITRSYALLFIVLNTLLAAWLFSPCVPFIRSLRGTPVAVFAISFALVLVSLLIIIGRVAVDDIKKRKTIPMQLFLFGCGSLVLFKVVASLVANSCVH